MTKFISLVGLGPGDPQLLTRKAYDEILSMSDIFVRTAEHPVVSQLPSDIRIHSFDHLYEQADNFEEVYLNIVDHLLEQMTQKEKLVYAVPGDPGVGEATVSFLRERATKFNIALQLIPGVSFIEPCLTLLEIDALDGLKVVDALLLAAGHHPPFSPDQAVLVAQIYSKMVAADVKLTLMNQYPDDHEVKLIHQGGTRDEELETLPLFQLDRCDRIGSMSTLFVPPLPVSSSLEAFQETVAHLRAPDGCPWDREQTHESLRMHLLEECYEALEAIDIGDLGALQEELGDLLLQIVLHAQIATEADDFTLADVIATVNTKIIQRHPHVFGEIDVDDVEKVLRNWEQLKAAEREEEGNQNGILDGVPLVLPALAQANEIQTRVARVGFDWPEMDGVLAKIDEELEEVKGAVDKQARTAELGDLLFAVVNYARWLEIDPETALRGANQRFRTRFAQLEKSAAAEGRELTEMELTEMNSLWEAVKGDQP